MACMTFTSCIGDEPANAECDIEKAWVHLDNPTSIFYLRADTLAEILSDYASSDILFPLARYNAVVGQIPLFVETRQAPSSTKLSMDAKNGLTTARSLIFRMTRRSVFAYILKMVNTCASTPSA